MTACSSLSAQPSEFFISFQEANSIESPFSLFWVSCTYLRACYLFRKWTQAGSKCWRQPRDIQERGGSRSLDRYHRFKELSTLRRQKLEDSYRFQFFQRDAEELEKWIQEKLQIASDENYKDPTNLQAKA